MKKLQLNLNEVKVESFAIEGLPLSKRGTVKGRQECEGDGGIEDPGGEFGGCSCRCCRCSCRICCRCGGGAG